MRIYVSGPMVGLPDFNFPAFKAEAKRLRDLGFEVIDPSENFDGKQNLPRPIYMRADVGHVLNVDALSVLPGAVKSKGSMLEIAIAHELGLPVWVAGSLNYQRPDCVQSGCMCEADGEPWTGDQHDGGILLEANALVHGERQEAYLRPLDDFQTTAKLLNAVFEAKLKVPFEPEDVALVMICVKLSRVSHRYKRDSLVDLAGYAETYQMTLDEKAEP